MCFQIFSIFLWIIIHQTKAIDLAVIDTDAGSDDAMAIMLMLKRSDVVKVMGITTVNGNTGVENVTENVLKVLSVMNRLDVPVYKGSAFPLSSKGFKTDNYFGYDGLCGVDHPTISVKEYVHSTAAPVFLAEIVQKYPGEIILFAIGPLTNIAIASMLNPDFFDQVKNIYILGGCLPGAHGTFGVGYDFNTALDPKAAQLIFKRAPSNSSNLKIVLFPSGSIDKSTIKWRLDVLGAQNSTEIMFLNQAESCTFDSPYWGGHGDFALVSAYLDPSAIISEFIGTLKVKSDGHSEVIDGNNSLCISKMNETLLQTFYLDIL